MFCRLIEQVLDVQKSFTVAASGSAPEPHHLTSMLSFDFKNVRISGPPAFQVQSKKVMVKKNASRVCELES